MRTALYGRNGALKIPLPMNCVECGARNNLVIDSDIDALEFSCEKCGEEHRGGLGLGCTRGSFLFVRAFHEHRETNDYSLSIVLSAMAVESELSRLHHKWEQIDGLLNLEDVTEEQLDKRIRRFRTIADKFEGVAAIMHPPGLEEFVNGNEELVRTIDNGFPSINRGTIARDFQTQLFWPRNRILHLGYAGYVEADSSRCLTFAQLGLRILDLIDQTRRSKI